MTVVIYDESFAGLLTAIYEVYEYKMKDVAIGKDETTYSLFGNRHTVHTNEGKSQRVLNKLEQKLSTSAMSMFYKTYLSGIPFMEDLLLRYVRLVLASKKSIENNYSHPDILMLQQTSRKVDREKHRMEAFVRFQLTKDGLYYAIIQPDYNVLPLISKHFKDRYADQRWLIYDSTRKYGIYYDLKDVSEVQMEFADLNDNTQLVIIHDDKENLYQVLWKQYFTSVNIQSRKNMKLHIRHMPKRYWRYLIEKQPNKRDW